MRLVLLFLLGSIFCSCTWFSEVDPLDTAIELTGVDTSQVDWRAIGPIGIAPQEHFVWTCGTFYRTPKEQAAID
jgi:hypothetical protein